MAKQSKLNINMSDRIANVIRDTKGEIIAVVGSEDIKVSDPVKGIQRYRVNDSFQLVCGAVFNPVMSFGKEPVLLLAVCEECRSPSRRGEEPRHGLCSKDRGNTCATCGQFLCPAHTKTCNDEKIRCPGCARRHALKSAVWSLFFRPKEED